MVAINVTNLTGKQSEDLNLQSSHGQSGFNMQTVQPLRRGLNPFCARTAEERLVRTIVERDADCANEQYLENNRWLSGNSASPV